MASARHQVMMDQMIQANPMTNHYITFMKQNEVYFHVGYLTSNLHFYGLLVEGMMGDFIDLLLKFCTEN